MIKDLAETGDGAEGRVDLPMLGETVELVALGDVEREYLNSCAASVESQSDAVIASRLGALAEMPVTTRASGVTGWTSG